MIYEVEQKFRVDSLGLVEGELGRLGAELSDASEQVDHYFAHPARDFAATDEALRIRHVGDRGFVTYKGPKIDTTTKTRREIELALPTEDDGVGQFAALLEALGFRPVMRVRKQRRKADIPWHGLTVEAALDDVDGVGQFVELELSAGPAEIDAAKQCVADLARELGLMHNETRSYLELLLES